MPLQTATGDTGGILVMVLFLVVFVGWLALMLVAMWKTYSKASQPGWVAIIPIVNVFGLLKIVHRPMWWFVLLIIPIVNIIPFIIVMNDLSKAFGRELGMTLLLIFLTAIGYMVLGFGDATYEKEPDPLFG